MLVSSSLKLQRPAFVMPGTNEPSSTPGLTAPDFGDSGVDLELNGCLHCLSLLVGVYGVEEALRSGLLMRTCGGHGILPSVRASAF